MDGFGATQQPQSPPPAPPPAAVSPPPPAVSPPASPPAPSPQSGAGVSGVGAGAGASPPPATAPATTTQTPTLPPEVQARLTQAAEWERKAQQFDQFQHLIPLGYQAYQRAGQPTVPPPPATPEQPANPFGLPAFDHGLLQFVGKDANGNIVNLPGAPPDAAIKVQQFQDQLRQVQQQFWADPGKFLAPLVQAEAKKIADQRYQEQFQGFQQQQAATQLIESNADWLFNKDTNGQTQQQYNPATGRYDRVLSPYGQAYRNLVQRAESGGLKDPQMQHDWAVSQIQNALYTAERQKQQAAATGTAAANNFVANAATSPPPPAGNYNPPPPAAGTSLKDVLRQRMEANGLTGDVISQQMARAGA